MDVANQYQEEKTDLFELFASLLKQWKVLVVITLAGVVMSSVIAFQLPKLYAVSAHVAMPDLSDVMAITNRGYSEEENDRAVSTEAEPEKESKIETEAKRLFQRYYDLLKSSMNISNYISKTKKDKQSITFSVISPKQVRRGAEVMPRTVQLSIMAGNEVTAVDFINDYIEFTNDVLIDEIKVSGQKRSAIEMQVIQSNIEALRFAAKSSREAELIKLREALSLANKVGLKKPDSIRLYSQANQRSINGLTSEFGGDSRDLFLMGSEYLEGHIHNLTTRKNDDPYIPGLLPLVKRIKQLETLTFDFAGVKLYRLHKKAVVDGVAEKPRRGLIIAIGAVLSVIAAILIALLADALKRRKAKVKA